MSGAFSISHIPQVKGDYYEIESDVNQLAMRCGLFGALRDGAPDSKWYNLSNQKKWSLELIAHRYPQAGREGQERAKRTIAALEDNTYWDTGNKYDS